MTDQKWVLFLDDERQPTWDLDDPEIARTCYEAIDLIKQFGLPRLISFDHDLGDNTPNAMHLMRWLIEAHLDQTLDLNEIQSIIIHSANPVGAANLAGLWDGFASNELHTEVRSELRPRTSIT